MPKPTSSVAMFVISTGGRASSSTSASGCSVRFCSCTQPARITTPAPISAERAGAPPAPRVGAGDRQQRQHEADREHERAADVDPARLAVRRLGDQHLREHGGDGGHRGAEPEDPVVGGAVDQHAADDQARAAADAEGGRDQADARGDLLARELVADDREAEREDAAAGALEHPARDQHLERVRQRRDDRARARTRRARSRAGGACRTCRRGGRRSACRPRRRAGSR